jgi:hypothetical protein
MNEDNKSDNNEGGQWVFMAASSDLRRRTACEASSAHRGKQTMRGSPFGEVAPLVAWHVSLVLCGRDLARPHFIGLWGGLA